MTVMEVITQELWGGLPRGLLYADYLILMAEVWYGILEFNVPLDTV